MQQKTLIMPGVFLWRAPTNHFHFIFSKSNNFDVFQKLSLPFCNRCFQHSHIPNENTSEGIIKKQFKNWQKYYLTDKFISDFFLDCPKINFELISRGNPPWTNFNHHLVLKFWPQSNQEHMKVGSVSPTDHLVSIGSATFWFELNGPLPLKACACYFLSNFIFSPNDSPSKTMKNIFYFI